MRKKQIWNTWCHTHTHVCVWTLAAVNSCLSLHWQYVNYPTTKANLVLTLSLSHSGNIRTHQNTPTMKIHQQCTPHSSLSLSLHTISSMQSFCAVFLTMCARFSFLCTLAAFCTFCIAARPGQSWTGTKQSRDAPSHES